MSSKQNPREKVNNPHIGNTKENKNSKRLVIGFIIFAVIVVGLIGYAFLYDRVLKYNKPVATVGEREINGKEFTERVKLERNSYVLQYNMIAAQMVLVGDNSDYVSYYKNQLTQLLSILDDTEYFGEYVLDNMIDEQIASIEAEKMGITVTDQEVEDMMQELFEYYPNGTATPTVTYALEPTSTLNSQQKTLVAVAPATETLALPTATLEEIAQTVESTATETLPPTATALELTPTSEEISGTATPYPTATVYTEDIYKQNYQDYITNLEGIGVSESVLRDYLRNYMLVQKVYDAVVSDVPRTQDQVWARHILVETQDEAIAVLNRLAGGEDWNTVCNEVTLDQSGQENCGDLGWFPQGQMVEVFETEAFRLDIGEISNPVESSFGWHVIQTLGHEERDIESDYDYQRLQSNYYDLWFQDIKDSLTISKSATWADHVPSEPSVAYNMRVSN
ncbi:MAG: hypothetical protein GYA52_01045 [Chloroflexi bacterium]|jgi:peptidyl-prolyl cis-trans isomerase D|nr:hypothetical protein [Chloroflexota bacterium]